jgi:hypothetical protein
MATTKNQLADSCRQLHIMPDHRRLMTRCVIEWRTTYRKICQSRFCSATISVFLTITWDKNLMKNRKIVAEKLDAKQLYLYKNIIYKDLAQSRQQDQLTFSMF